MCISMPGQVVEINGNRAKINIAGTVYNAGLGLIEGLKTGDYVLLHAGYVIQKLDDRAAEESLELFRQMGQL